MNAAEKDYYDFVGNRLGPLMCFFIFLAIRDWERATFYALSPDECEQLSGPVSHAGPRFEKMFKLPNWVHTVITTSDDTVTLLFVFASYFERTGLLDKILPVFSTANKETEKKHAKKGTKPDVQPPLDLGQVQQKVYSGSNGFDRSAIDPRQVYQIGAQWSAD